jgi:putative endonuclease
VKNKWKVYIVECADGTYYTGITTDTKRRLLEHNYSFKSAKYTRSRRPVKLVYEEDSQNRSTASKREYEIKKMKRKDKIILVENYKNEL